MKKEINGKYNIDISAGKDRGFTIIELLVAMAISLIVMSSVYSVYRSQQKSYIVREQISMMQQNLRAGMTIMTGEIRMAGYVHPSVAATAGFTDAEANTVTFTRLKDTLALPLEQIQYSLADIDGDGNTELVRRFSDVGDPLGAAQRVAENIDALNFVYLDTDGVKIDTPVPAANLPLIRSVQVTMIARTKKRDQGYTDNNTYTNQQDEDIPTASDSYRRRILSREIKCRNL